MGKWLLVASGVIVLGAAVAVLIGQARETFKAERMAATLLQGASHPGSDTVDFASFTELPPPVARYFRHVLKDGQKLIRMGKMRQSGMLRTSTTTETWSSFTASHLVVPPATGFIWNAKVEMPLAAHVRVLDSYIAGVRKPYLATLSEPLVEAGTLLYRRGNFNGTFDQLICDAQRAVGDAQIALSPGFRWGTTVLPGQSITMEHVLDQTCITYPETYVREMSGEQIKLILEDVCDNLFNPDPYYQQGGDMVRVGGMDYVCDPRGGAGNRISSMTLDDGTAIDPARTYKVAGWATVGSQAPGPPIWDVVAEYLRSVDVAEVKKLNTPVLRGVSGNPGIADYGGRMEA